MIVFLKRIPACLNLRNQSLHSAGHFDTSAHYCVLSIKTRQKFNITISPLITIKTSLNFDFAEKAVILSSTLPRQSYS